VALLEGDWATSFVMALETLELTPAEDHSRRMLVLDLLVENILVPEPVRFAYLEQELEQAAQLEPAELAYALAQAARFHVSRGEFDAAEAYLNRVKQIEESSVLGPPTYLRTGLAEARILGARGARDARGAAEGSLAFFDAAVSYFENRSLDSFVYPFYLERAEILRRLGDVNAAGIAFEDALRIIENSDDQLPGRLAFDAERRRAYELAIRFYLEHDPRKAWEHVQRYKTKLDLNLLHQFGRDAVEEPFPVDVPRLDDRTVVEYTLLEDRLVIWVIESGVLGHHEIALDRDRLTADVQRFVHHTAIQADPAMLSQLGLGLYDTLIAPFIEGVEPGRTLVIVPDRILHRLSFAGLPSPEGRFLVEDFPIAGAPTLSRALRSAEPWPAAPRLLAIGSPNQSISMRLELEALKDVHPSIKMLDARDVTPEAVIDDSRGRSMVHFAGHSAVDGASGLSSAILLDGIGGANTITAADVAGFELAPGALVVLSSCDSSVGNSIGGLGVRGLTSAFLAAGAGSVVGSLWTVDDEATGDLMTSFHRHLGTGATIAEALRSAQLEFIETGGHPYHWSAFTVTGDQSTTRPIPFATATEAATVSR
jgi:CHAT domain-containing protein